MSNGTIDIKSEMAQIDVELQTLRDRQCFLQGARQAFEMVLNGQKSEQNESGTKSQKPQSSKKGKP